MIKEFLKGFGFFLGYYILAVGILLFIRAVFKPYKELFRKMLHMTCAISIFILLYQFETWYISMLAAIVFALILYPILSLAERFPKIMEILVERKSGEIRLSLILVFLMMAILIGVFWGYFGKSWKYIIIISVMAWGFGDASAALVGKAIGKKPIKLSLADGKKTREGTAAMYIVSIIIIFIALSIYTELAWYLLLLAAAIVASIAAFVELVTHKGYDTITVPLSAAIPLFLIMRLFSIMGV